MSSAFGYSCSHCSGRPRRGFTPTKRLSTHGKLVQMHSWPSTSRWARPMPSGIESPVFSNYRIEAWERLQEYIQACPHHDMEEWLIIQNFFHGLNQQAKDRIDAAAGGSFLSLDVAGAK